MLKIIDDNGAIRSIKPSDVNKRIKFDQKKISGTDAYTNHLSYDSAVKCSLPKYKDDICIVK